MKIRIFLPKSCLCVHNKLYLSYSLFPWLDCHYQFFLLLTNNNWDYCDHRLIYAL
ncbi:hypothetical protein [Moraxella lacunata]|uniref:hypothetical protein n=1 Tax=Moraxella lacunata TaxID=477 RepID=UPI003EE11CE4